MEASALELAIVGGAGIVTGSVLILLGGAVQAHHATVTRRAQQAHDQRLASYRERVDAYDEVLTFFSRIRDEIDNVILEDKPWGEDVSGPQERARLDALMQVHGSDAFRQITREWRQVFDQTLYTLARWRWLDDPARNNADETASVRAQLEKDQAKLLGIVDRLQEQARRDVHSTAFEPTSGAMPTARPMRLLGTFMITAAVLLITAPAWRGLLPAITQVAAAHRDPVAFGLLVAGFVIVLGEGLLGRRRARQNE
ncbi:hypothetical protein HC028_09500 [Planosporangium flavigriseum]|uniref:Uncharacterized protein n=1 Tax=Planosporangium flavigriseum TaxID=373681 RepID=A0A8J3LJZ6_9ACTN|nr:hypothetical protein [Planosporangium flavigriseum]NJC64736.1 hypothetical protein [Planosporangium flavigriseum]GIG74037.1 hypothetical protein Pfl04_24410 [Planosporangium flavigriseum]